jgi:hypothetical protein
LNSDCSKVLLLLQGRSTMVVMARIIRRNPQKKMILQFRRFVDLKIPRWGARRCVQHAITWWDAPGGHGREWRTSPVWFELSNGWVLVAKFFNLDLV